MNFSLNWHYSLVTYRFSHIEDALKHDSKATNEVVWLDAKRESKVTNMVEEYVEISSDKILEDELAEKFGGGIQSRKFGIEIMRSDRLPILSHKRFVAFKNLLHLELLDRMNTWKGKGLFEFLEFSPNLQTLVTFKVSKEVWFLMEEVPSCVVYQLKGFKVLDFDDESSLFEMVTYILNNATTLDKLTISTS
ncbi:hypothetical protein V6N13_029738 [Hibiscus sabdariffa]|uniref:FBD domain-containing protein n=1 Tax=Hibiscus sabdariffa TaxID=183260 RepID=A0ABR2T942_9ROSI